MVGSLFLYENKSINIWSTAVTFGTFCINSTIKSDLISKNTS